MDSTLDLHCLTTEETDDKVCYLLKPIKPIFYCFLLVLICLDSFVPGKLVFMLMYMYELKCFNFLFY